MTNSLRRRSLLGAALATGFAAPALAQTYPSRPVRLVVPYPPGGATDITARLLAQELSQSLGQSFAVENRGGGASVTGTQAVATAPADGHTLGVFDSAFVVNPGLLGSRLPYDTRRDFSFVSVLVRSPLVLVVPASAAWQDIAALVRDAKARPNELTFGSAGNGTAVHMAGEQFRLAAGFTFLHVPYRGGGPMITDLIAGRVQMAFGTIPAMAEHVRAGRLRALAITGDTRAALLPEVPSMAEAGFPAVDAALINALVGPVGLPAPVLARLAEASQQAVTSQAMRSRLTELGFAPVGSTPAEASSQLLAQIGQWERVIREGDIKVD
ncbi:Bug family tripartite tricarboxylate transporter substrate binding protein [Falsiroseomonas tokyonensis]|uniref:Bug family tripartite tricarboxylate transporter substrate binding protein n=1 Tax=Falsiroseomonas tokyonensis TaxID=430521 RepID=A0ABV7BQV1_9PROT|nr:tripartite tricarboxylate transporter substrate binding protein [Falsiroseomonas tokyonensis]MBU8537044.1 tripartite tricarboxylate transporter substrate binding protein [Falsiroseomonas tokyonensis]